MLSDNYPALWAEVQAAGIDPEVFARAAGGRGVLRDWDWAVYDCNHCRDGERCERRLYNEGQEVRVAAEGLEYRRCDRWANRQQAKCMARVGLQRRFQQHTFANYAPQTEEQRIALEVARQYATGFRPHGSGLILSGPVGTGKTHLSAALVRELLETPYEPLFIAVPSLLARIRASFDDDQSQDRALLQRAGKVDLLVLDDFGTERITEWAQEQLYILVNERYERLLPIVLTTNCTGRELAQKAGERIVSRLHEMCRVVIVDGPDYRRRRP